MSANDYQVGGTHYKNANIPDHWDIAYELGWCYLVAAATKYLWRLGKKGDKKKHIEDVEKAIQYLQKKVEQMKTELEQELDSGVPMSNGYVNQDGVMKNLESCN